MKVRKVFTTGQVAKICDVAPRTASKWFDSGKLAGYRIPLSNDRRVPRENLIRFLKENGMPLGELEDEGIAKVLLVGAGEAITARLAELLPAADGFRIAAAADGFDDVFKHPFDAAVLAERIRPVAAETAGAA